MFLSRNSIYLQRSIPVEVYSKHYSRVFSYFRHYAEPDKHPVVKSIPQTWFDFSIDTLYIDPETFKPQHADEDDAFVAFIWRNIQYTPGAMDKGIRAMGPEFFAVENLALTWPDSSREAHPEEYDCAQECIVHILNEVFRNVKNLTIVVAHYEIDSSESDDLVFMDAIDLNDALAIYRSVGEEDIEPRAVPVHPRLAKKQLDDDSLETVRDDLRTRQDLGGLEPILQIPNITHQICMSSRRKQSFDEAKSLYHTTINSNRKRKGMEPYWLE